jgi:hypothetical protein
LRSAVSTGICSIAACLGLARARAAGLRTLILGAGASLVYALKQGMIGYSQKALRRRGAKSR